MDEWKEDKPIDRSKTEQVTIVWDEENVYI